MCLWRDVANQTNLNLAGPTEAAILLELKTAEALEVAEGREAASNTQSTPTAFIKSGLQLEESQYVLVVLKFTDSLSNASTDDGSELKSKGLPW